MDRRKFLKGAIGTMVASGLTTLPMRANASDVVSILRSELESGRACGANAAAIQGTLSRLAKTRSPGSGRTIVVDIPSQHLAAYNDGYLELESRVVVGDASWKTPDLDTRITYVRFNPTWTVPESIIKSRSWRSKLAEDPGYFTRLNFKIAVDGQMLDPDIASQFASKSGLFVQQPGAGNALGNVKIGLADGDAIYLHDTNDHDAFNETQRALSHGCVRVEKAVELAAWSLGISEYDAFSYVDNDDRRDHRVLPSPVRVLTTYFTAWPDEHGNVLYYPDPYNRDKVSDNCDYQNPTTNAWGASTPDTVIVDPGYPSEVIIYAN